MRNTCSAGEGMRIFLTGATGFAGSHLVDRLLADGHEPGDLVRVNYHSIDGARLIAHPV